MTHIEEGFSFLKDSGLNLIAVINCADLPERTTNFMTASGIPVADYRQLLLIGHGGRRMWSKLQVSNVGTTDPVDRYAVSLMQRFFRDYLNDPQVLPLYPDSRYAPPLQQLGESVGWSSPSPLGSGISPEYGVWFAYRAAFLIDADLPPARGTASVSPCDSCEEKPCIDACPVAAVQKEGFDIETCAPHRLSMDSPCADRCLARLACPLHPEHRYTLDQIQYHYRHSLTTLREWYCG